MLAGQSKHPTEGPTFDERISHYPGSTVSKHPREIAEDSMLLSVIGQRFLLLNRILFERNKSRI